MKLDREERWVIFFIVLAFALTAALVIIHVVSHNKAQRECEDRGGSYDSYNCRTMLIPMSCGSGCTTIMPEEACDYHCVGATR